MHSLRILHEIELLRVFHHCYTCNSGSTINIVFLIKGSLTHNQHSSFPVISPADGLVHKKNIVNALELKILQFRNKAEHGTELTLAGVQVPLNLNPKDWAILVAGKTGGGGPIRIGPPLRSRPWIARSLQKFAQW